MGTLVLAGGSILTYGAATHGTSPAAQYSAWCSAAGVSDATTLEAIDDDDHAFMVTLQAPFFATGPGNIFIATEGGLGFFVDAPFDAASNDYTPGSLPGVSRFYGTRHKPTFALTYHAGTGDLKSAGGKVQKAGSTTLIFAQHSQFDDDAVNRYDFAAKITPLSIELVGTTTDVSASVLLTEWVEDTDILDESYLQQETVHTQTSGTTYKYTLTLAEAVTGISSAASMLGAVAALAYASPAAKASVPHMLGGALYVTAATSSAYASAPAVLGSPAVVVSVPMFSYAAAASPLGAVRAVAYHDFTGQLGDATTRYVMDLTTPGGLVRVPISSWQATLQTGSSNYVQCVVPAVLEWVDSINAATAFTITRAATPPGGAAIEYEMASAPLGQVQIYKGPTNYTATLSGYSTAFAEDEAPDAAYDRHLAGVRSVSSGSGGYRVRCAIDWLLRPAQRAYLPDGSSFVCRYVNYYRPQGNDSYMDVGE